MEGKTLLQQYAEPIAHAISSAVEIAAAILIGIAVLIAIKNYLLISFSKRNVITQRDIRCIFRAN